MMRNNEMTMKKELVKKELILRGSFNVHTRHSYEWFSIEPLEDGSGVVVIAWPDEIDMEAICNALGISERRRRRMERRGIFNEWSDYDCRSLLERYEENEE